MILFAGVSSEAEDERLTVVIGESVTRSTYLGTVPRSTYLGTLTSI